MTDGNVNHQSHGLRLAAFIIAMLGLVAGQGRQAQFASARLRRPPRNWYKAAPNAPC
jgi:hypothetical protein